MTHKYNRNLDKIDRTILEERTSARMYHKGPRIGDFCDMLDGRRMRFSHDWGDDIQVSQCGQDSSFYLAAGGHASFSGGLEPAISKNTLEQKHGSELGRFWFFHHDHRTAHNGVQVKVPCRVFAEAITKIEGGDTSDNALLDAAKATEALNATDDN